jgi:hypothetical protein
VLSARGNWLHLHRLDIRGAARSDTSPPVSAAPAIDAPSSRNDNTDHAKMLAGRIDPPHRTSQITARPGRLPEEQTQKTTLSGLS